MSDKFFELSGRYTVDPESSAKDLMSDAAVFAEIADDVSRLVIVSRDTVKEGLKNA